MSARDSGYEDSWHGPPSAQPGSDTNLLPFSEMNKQSQPLTLGQYSFDLNSYRDPCGTSVSGFESMPDYMNQTPVDDPQDHDIDPNLPPPSAALAGVFEGNDVFDMNPSAHSIPQNIPLYSDVHQQVPFFHHPSSGNNDLPWNQFQNLLAHDTMTPPRNPNYYAHPQHNRPGPRPDSGFATQTPSTASVSGFPHTQTEPSQGPSTSYPPPSSAGGVAHQDDAESSFSQDFQVPQPSASKHRPRTQSASQQSPPRSAPRGQTSRKQSTKFYCTLCPTDQSKSFNTSNDLARHERGVHDVFTKGDKIWRCKLEGCNCSEKIWPRRDNFVSHLKRMHFPEDHDAALAVVDDYEELYDPAVHSAPHLTQGENQSGGNRRKRTFNTALSSDVESPVSKHPRHLGMITPRQKSSSGGGVEPNFQMPPGAASSMANNGHQTATNWSENSAMFHQTTTQFRQAQLSAEPGSNTARFRKPLTAPPTQSDLWRQRRELQEHDSFLQQASPVKSSAQDFVSMGGGVMEQQFVDPSWISAPQPLQSSLPRSQDSIELKHDQEMDDIFKSLSSEQKAELLRQYRRSEESDYSQEYHRRSVSRALMKQSADGDPKIWQCFDLIGKKGLLTKCQAAFNSKSELSKHRRRHQKRFGCTFDHCYSKFGTKWEWKRHEHSQHIQNAGWRCRYVNGPASCQKLFKDKVEFEEHLRQHLGDTNPERIAKEMKECYLAEKWLGSFWCGYCKRILLSQREFGRPMDQERLEHIARHILSGVDSSTWVELDANGKTKGEMKQIDEKGSLKTKSTTKPHPTSRSASLDGREDDDASEVSDSDDSYAVLDSQRKPQMPKINTLGAFDSSHPSSSHESQTGPMPNTPAISIHTPEGLLIREPMLERIESNVHRPAHVFTDDSDFRTDETILGDSMIRYCCRCRHTTWTNYSDRCDYGSCQHTYCADCEVRPPHAQYEHSIFSTGDAANLEYEYVGPMR